MDSVNRNFPLKTIGKTRNGQRSGTADITERKRAEEALRESEATARALMDSPVDSILVVNPDGIILDTNQTFAQRIGRRVDELIGRCVYDFFPPELVKSRRARVDEIVHFGVSIRFEDERAGIQLDHSAHPICDAQGKVTKIAIVARDITERKRMEEALRESEEKYHTLFEESRDAISITTREGKFIDINQAWLELLGYTKEELMSLNVQETYANPDDRPRVQKEIERKGFVRDYEIKLRKKDGTAIDSLLTFTVWRAYNGNILGYQGIIRDITERKRAEDQILRQGAVLDGISKVFRQALICKTEEELSSKSLTVAEELTGSKFGWIGEINQEGRLDAIALSDPGWNECRMSKSDAVIMIKDMEIRGIWGEVLKDEQSLIVNDPLSHPDSVGTPEGHPPITAFLGVPLKQAGKTFGMIALANKESGYDLPDQEAVETLSVAIAEALKRKRIEKSLMESERKLRLITENMRDTVFGTIWRADF